MTDRLWVSLWNSGGNKSVLGVLAYLAGYAVVFGWKGEAVEDLFARTTVGSDGAASLAETLAGFDLEVSAVEGAGWLFYNAHQVPVGVPTPAGRSSFRNLLYGAGSDFTLVFLVPPAVLVLAGVLATVGTSEAGALPIEIGDSPVGRYWNNAAVPVMIGYLPLSLIGSRVFWADGFGPPALFSLLLVGIAYPFVFGGLGGAVGMAIRTAGPTAED